MIDFTHLLLYTIGGMIFLVTPAIFPHGSDQSEGKADLEKRQSHCTNARLHIVLFWA